MAAADWALIESLLQAPASSSTVSPRRRFAADTERSLLAASADPGVRARLRALARSADKR